MLMMILAILPEWLITFGEDLGSIWPILVIMAGGVAFGRRVYKKNLNEAIDGKIVPALEEIKLEFKNNGGSSLKDSVDHIKDTIVTHTQSDAMNFEIITATLDKLINGQDLLTKSAKRQSDRMEVIEELRKIDVLNAINVEKSRHSAP